MNEKIFLSYAREDKEQVREIYQKLLASGFTPWMDTESLIGGDDWLAEIKEIIAGHGFFVACVSHQSVRKAGVLQEELQYALEVQQKKFKRKIFIIPVRLDDCELPPPLRQWQWIDWFADQAPEKLTRTILKGIAQRSFWLKRIGRDIADSLLAERHWPLLLPLAIPALYLILRDACQDAIGALAAMTGLQLFAAATLIGSGILYWAVRRQESRRLWLTSMGAALGILILLLVFWQIAGGPKPPAGEMVVYVADFTGDNAQTSKDACAYASRLFATLSEKTQTLPVHVERCYERVASDAGMKFEEKVERARLIARKYSANVVLWGTVQASEVQPYIQIKPPESRNERFADLFLLYQESFPLNKQPQTGDEQAEVVALVSALSVLSHSSTSYDDAINVLKDFESSPLANYYRGVLLIKRAQSGNNPKGDLDSAVRAFGSVGDRLKSQTELNSYEKQLRWKARVNQAIAQTLRANSLEPPDADRDIAGAVQLYEEVMASDPTDNSAEWWEIYNNYGVALFESGKRRGDVTTLNKALNVLKDDALAAARRETEEAEAHQESGET